MQKKHNNIGAYGIAILLGLLFALVPEVHAGSLIPLPDGRDIDLPSPQGDTAVQRFESFLGPVARVVRIVMGAIAVLMIVIAGFGMVLSADSEEKVKEQRQTMTYAVIGLFILSLAGGIAEVFDFRSGSIVDENGFNMAERGALFDRATSLVVTFIKFLLGSLAAFSAIRSGAVLVTSSSSEEDITNEKKTLLLSAMGLVMVMVSDLFIKKILFINRFDEQSGEIVTRFDHSEFLQQLVGLTNLLVKFVGPVLMFMLVVGAVIYVTAAGNEDRMGIGKKILINSVIGIAVIYGAFAIVSTLITGVF